MTTQEIHADHCTVRPLDQTSSAYDFFYRVYRDNPILEEQVVTRDNVIAGMEATCDRSNANPDLQVPIALDSAMREKVVAATASLINTVDLRDVNPNPPVVTRIDPDGVAHVNYGFSGPAKKLFVCMGTARASLKVQFSISRQVPIREPQNLEPGRDILAMQAFSMCSCIQDRSAGYREKISMLLFKPDSSSLIQVFYGSVKAVDSEANIT